MNYSRHLLIHTDKPDTAMTQGVQYVIDSQSHTVHYKRQQGYVYVILHMLPLRTFTMDQDLKDKCAELNVIVICCRSLGLNSYDAHYHWSGLDYKSLILTKVLITIVGQ